MTRPRTTSACWAWTGSAPRKVAPMSVAARRDRRKRTGASVVWGRHWTRVAREGFPIVPSAARPLLLFAALRMTGWSFAPRGSNAVGPRVRDQLPEMFVQIVRHREGRFDDRVIAAEQLSRAGELCRVDAVDRLLGIRESFLEVLEHVLLRR